MLTAAPSEILIFMEHGKAATRVLGTEERKVLQHIIIRTIQSSVCVQLVLLRLAVVPCSSSVSEKVNIYVLEGVLGDFMRCVDARPSLQRHE